MGFPTVAVILIRLISPLIILRYPLLGIFINWIIDVFDVVLVRLLGGTDFGGGLIDYQTLDKLLDTYYLSFAFYVSRKWHGMYARRAVAALFVYRVIGVILLAVSGQREFLFFFPNAFEPFFVYCLVTAKWFPRCFPDSIKKLLVIVAIIGSIWLTYEFINHYLQISLGEAMNLFFGIEWVDW